MCQSRGPGLSGQSTRLSNVPIQRTRAQWSERQTVKCANPEDRGSVVREPDCQMCQSRGPGLSGQSARLTNVPIQRTGAQWSEPQTVKCANPEDRSSMVRAPDCQMCQSRGPELNGQSTRLSNVPIQRTGARVHCET